jgi:hypothetical protein
MDIERKAIEIVSDAERRIGVLAQEALRLRDYDLAQKLSAIARGLSVTIQADYLLAPKLMAEAIEDTSNSTITPKKSAAAPRFPRFYRDNGHLVKVSRTYEHRSPLDVLHRLAALITQCGADGRQFSTERLLPPQEPALSDIPHYQIYLCLAFLVQRGVVRRMGRLGYVIEQQTADLQAAVQNAWESLPER